MKRAAKTIFLILILQGIPVFSQTNALDYYLKIKPFASTRDDVEKIYGKGDPHPFSQYTVFYKKPEFNFSVTYSEGVCGESSFWNAPEWTVTYIAYGHWKSPPKLKDLIGNNKNFKKSYESDVLNHVEYNDHKAGIKILYDEEEKELLHIILRGSEKDQQKFDCDNLK